MRHQITHESRTIAENAGIGTMKSIELHHHTRSDTINQFNDSCNFVDQSKTNCRFGLKYQ